MLAYLSGNYESWFQSPTDEGTFEDSLAEADTIIKNLEDKAFEYKGQILT